MRKLNYWIILITFTILSSSCSEEKVVDQNVRNDLSDDVKGIIQAEINNIPVVLYADSKKGLFVAFERRLDLNAEVLDFQVVQASFPEILKDQYGNTYDVNGNLTGDNSGDDLELKRLDMLVGYWFFFPSFYKEVELIDGSLVSNPLSLTGNIDDWLINENYIFSGSFRDGIPSIDNPEFKELSGKELIDDAFYSNLPGSDLVSVVNVGDIWHVYPHRMLDYHEIVNDQINESPFTVSYCPLTGTSKAWRRDFNEQIHEFGVSGLLYNSNLILYDRTTESNWSQILNKSVNGSLSGQNAEQIQVLEMKFSESQKLDGKTLFLSSNTGFSFNYQNNLYTTYKNSSQVSFPLMNSSDIIPAKERVLGIIKEDKAWIFRFEDFK